MRAHSPIFKVVLYLRHLFQFLEVHKRLPIRPSTVFNDFLFRLKTSSELGSPLRTFITDKEFAKIYVEKKLGAGTTPVTLCVLRTPEEAETYVPATCLARLYSAIGERQKVLEMLDKAYVDRDAQLQYIGVDPLYDELRSEPRFQELIRKLAL